MNKNQVIAFAVFAVFLNLGVFFLLNRPEEVVSTPNPENNPPVTSATTTSPVGTTSVKIALLDTTGTGIGKSRGCDTVTMVTRTVATTTAPLTAALKELFAYPEGMQPSTMYNFIARTKGTLKFDHATVENGAANIYLTGSLSGLAGVCDDPRAAIQLEETALQFPTVEKVQLYLNGTATTLTPNEKGE